MFQEDDDEILQELKRCQAELRAVSSHNHEQLTRLLKLAREALYRHDLKKKLRDAEAKVQPLRPYCSCELYPELIPFIVVVIVITIRCNYM